MPGAVLLLELGAMILCLGLLGTLAARFSVSPIPLYLLAGLAFGLLLGRRATGTGRAGGRSPGPSAS